MKDKINNALDKFYSKKVLSIVITSTVLYLALVFLCGKISENLELTAIKRIIFGVVVMTFMYWLRKGHIYKNNFKNIGRGLVLILPTSIFAAVGSFAVIMDVDVDNWFNAHNFYVAVIVGIAAGLTEEFITRGLPLGSVLSKATSRKEVMLLLLLSSVVFGILHIGHVFINGANLLETVLQATQATGLGLFFGAVFLRTGSIIPGIIGHAIWDYCTTYTPVDINSSTVGNAGGSMNITGVIIIGAAFAVLALFLLRKSKWNEIKENFDIIEA